MPGSSDRVILAVKSSEDSAADHQTSFISVLSIDGKELMAEVEIPGSMKYVEPRPPPHTLWCIRAAFLLSAVGHDAWGNAWVGRCCCRFEGLEFI